MEDTLATMVYRTAANVEAMIAQLQADEDEDE